MKIWQHSNLKQPNTHRKLVETRAIIVKFGGRKSSAVKKDSLSNLKVALSQKMLEDFQISQKIFQKTILNFFYPVNDNHKTSIVNFFDFTSLTYLRVAQKSF